jgi:hypothetical protein
MSDYSIRGARAGFVKLFAAAILATSSSRAATPVNRACGSSANQTFGSAPTTNLCCSGTASVVTADGNFAWLWTRASTDKGRTTASCDAMAGGHKGINAGNILNASLSVRTAMISDFQKLGVKWFRIDFTWAKIQPGSTTDFKTATWGTLVQALVAANISVLGIIDYSVGWANGGQSEVTPPTNPSSYANYAAMLAQHFGPMGVHTWELWNEENGGAWTVDPVKYTAMLKQAYTALHQADSSVTVLVGGMAPATTGNGQWSGPDFLQAIYDHGGQGYFDAVGFHPYGIWEQMYSTTPSVLGVMTAHGDGNKKIWVTEESWFTGTAPGADTEAQQAALVTQLYTEVETAPWAGPLFWYDYQDDCADQSNLVCVLGLLNYDGTSKASYPAYQQAPD